MTEEEIKEMMQLPPQQWNQDCRDYFNSNYVNKMMWIALEDTLDNLNYKLSKNKNNTYLTITYRAFPQIFKNQIPKIYEVQLLKLEAYKYYFSFIIQNGGICGTNKFSNFFNTKEELIEAWEKEIGNKYGSS